jgi:tripartite-type tricarboxylate transporter receptor subunit TctC
MHRIFKRVVASLALLLAVPILPVQAQNWPARAVKCIVPFCAGADI